MRADRPASIHHVQVAIPAGGEDEARRFYAGVLGLREIDKPENLRARGGVWFETRNLQLHLGVDRSFTPATKAEQGDHDENVSFDVVVENGRIVLTPVRVQRAQAVRDKLQQLGITEQDVEDARRWVMSSPT